MIVGASYARPDRVAERRRAVALARHYREYEGLSIRQIADRIGRSPATIKAYFCDPSDANKGLRLGTGGQGRRSRAPGSPARRGTMTKKRSPIDSFCARAGCPAAPVGLGF